MTRQQGCSGKEDEEDVAARKRRTWWREALSQNYEKKTYNNQPLSDWDRCGVSSNVAGWTHHAESRSGSKDEDKDVGARGGAEEEEEAARTRRCEAATTWRQGRGGARRRRRGGKDEEDGAV